MTGLEKITSEIKADADKSVAAIIDKANAEASGILAGAEKEAAEAVAKINHDVSVRLSASKSTAESAAALRKRRLILEEKQKLIVSAQTTFFKGNLSVRDVMIAYTSISVARRTIAKPKARIQVV